MQFITQNSPQFSWRSTYRFYVNGRTSHKLTEKATLQTNVILKTRKEDWNVKPLRSALYSWKQEDFAESCNNIQWQQLWPIYWKFQERTIAINKQRKQKLLMRNRCQSELSVMMILSLYKSTPKAITPKTPKNVLKTPRRTKSGQINAMTPIGTRSKITRSAALRFLRPWRPEFRRPLPLVCTV